MALLLYRENIGTLLVHLFSYDWKNIQKEENHERSTLTKSIGQSPDLTGRESILKIHAQKVRIGDDVDFNVIARMTSGASGAKETITGEEFMEILDKK